MQWIWTKSCISLGIFGWGYHYSDVMMGALASKISSLAIVYSNIYSDADQRKHQSSASLAFVQGIHRGPANSPHKWPETRKMFPFDDVIMTFCKIQLTFQIKWPDIVWEWCIEGRTIIQQLKYYVGISITISVASRRLLLSNGNTHVVNWYILFQN